MLCGAPTFLSGFGCPMPPRLRGRLTIDDYHTTAHLVKHELLSHLEAILRTQKLMKVRLSTCARWV